MSSQRAIFDLIYGALDKGEYEVAQKLCLKPEVAKFQLAQALLSYTHASLRQYDKALEVGRKLLQFQPSEDGIVNALGCAFKLCRSDEDFATCYENALKNPSTAMLEHFHMELFSCYGRMLQPKKMQQVAQKLYRQFDHPKFIFWIVSSMVLQSDLPKAILPVAEKMLKKVFYVLSPTKQPGAEELHLFIAVLVLQNKYTDAIATTKELLSRPVSNDNKLQDEEHFQANVNMVAVQQLSSNLLLLDLFWQTRNFSDAKQQALLILNDFPDQWNVYTFLNGVALSSLPIAPSSMAMLPSNALSDLVCFDNINNWEFSVLSDDGKPYDLNPLTDHLHYLIKQQKQHPKLRGPYLAMIHVLLELFARYGENSIPFLSCGDLKLDSYLQERNQDMLVWIKNSLSTFQFGTPNDFEISKLLLVLFIEYLTNFQSKYCCYMDLKPFLYKLCLLQPVSIATSVWNGIVQWISQELEQNQYGKLVAKLQNSKAALNGETNVNINDSSATVEEDIKETEIETQIKEVKDEEEDDDEGEYEEGEPNTNDNKSAKGKSKKKKASKKKNRKTKKTTSSADSTVSASESENKKNAEVTMKTIDVKHLQSLVNKDEELLLMICCYSQMDYVRSYVAHLMKLPLIKEKMLARYELFDRTREIFEDGVAGESRTIQPGDDLQLINSSQHRMEMKTLYAGWASSISTKKLDSITASGEDKITPMISLVTQWCSTLSNAIHASKYSFTLKVDYMETSKILLNAPAVLHAFDNLGVKYIQNDSLSYLLVPSLLEGGLYIESIKQYRTILHYYKVGRRETLDMLSRAFEYANYDKVLDLVNFVEESDKSLQLAVTKAELPLLEVIQKRLKVSEVTSYLQELFDGKLPESQEFFTEESIRSLVSHLDLQILGRMDGLPEQTAGFMEEKNLRVSQIIHRISYAQAFLRFAFGFLHGDAAMAKSSRDLLEQVTSEESFGKLEPNDSMGYLSFDQNIEGHKSFAACHHQSFLQMADYLMLVLAVSSSDVKLHPSVESIPASFHRIQDSFERLNEFLVYQTRIAAGYVGGKSVIHPEFIRRVSALQRLLITWGAVFFLHTLPTVATITKEAKNEVVEKISQIVATENSLALPLAERFFLPFPATEDITSDAVTSRVVIVGYWNVLFLWLAQVVTVRRTLLYLIGDVKQQQQEVASDAQQHQPWTHPLLFQQDTYVDRLKTTNEVIAQAHNFSLQRLEGLLDVRVCAVVDSVKELIQ